MNFFRFFQTGVIVGSLVVGVIFATFFIYHDAFFAALPSMFFGLYPILYFCANCCHVGPALHRGKFFPNQWFRFTMEAFYLFFICAAFTMIILAAPLVSVFDMASSSINSALMSFTASSLMFHFVQKQKQLETQVLPLFDGESNVEEIDSLDLSCHSEERYQKMWNVVTLSRKKTSSFSVTSYAVAFLTLIFSIYILYASKPEQFDIFQQPTFSVSCINQTVLDQSATHGSFFSESNCRYPSCLNRRFSVSPVLDQFTMSDSLFITYNGGNISSGCQQYTVVQHCGLGYDGLVGYLKIGAACQCLTTTTYNKECATTEKLHGSFSLLNIAWLLIFYLSMVIVSVENHQIIRWELLRMK